MEFLEDLYAYWSGLKSRRYMVPREQSSAGRRSGTHVLNNLIYRFSDTAFQNGTCIIFIFARTHRERQRSFIKMVEATPPNHVQWEWC